MSGKPKLNLAASHADWKNLIQSAIDRAEKTNDRRVAGLKRALVSGNIEMHLRKLGIVCTEDLNREFPDEPPPTKN